MGVIAVSIIAGVLAVTIGLSTAASLLVERHRVAAAADAAALAAADAASGLVPGVPCELAATVAAAGGASIDRCVVDGSTATVSALSATAVVPIAVAATAGQPVSADSGSTDDSKK